VGDPAFIELAGDCRFVQSLKSFAASHPSADLHLWRRVALRGPLQLLFPRAARTRTRSAIAFPPTAGGPPGRVRGQQPAGPKLAMRATARP
jgi:hypothetical protein